MDFYSIIHGAAVHMIDVIMWVMGARPVEVVAYGNNLATAGSGLRFNDFAAMLMRFENGVLAKVSAAGGCAHPHFHRLAIFGDKKTFLHELNGACLLELSHDGAHRTEVTEEYPAKAERVKVLTSFVDSILDSAFAPLVSAQEALDVMAVCFAAEASVMEGKPQQVHYFA
jgi:predicted dehydrogenase